MLALLGRTLADRHGTTLVEILAAVAVISLGLVAFAAAIPLSSYAIQEGNQLSTATFLANQRLEQVRSATWIAPNCGLGLAGVDELGVSISASAPPTSGGRITFPDENAVAAPYAQYRRTVRVADSRSSADCDGAAAAELRQVTVTVSYAPLTGAGQAAAGRSKSAVLTLYLARR